SGIRFFEQAHIKDVAAYLKLVANPRDELAFKRLARMLPGVGGKSADKLWAKFGSGFGASGFGLAAANTQPETQNAKRETAPLASALQKCSAAVPKKAAVAWAQFVATVSQLEAPDVRTNTEKMISLVIEAGYEDYLQDNFANFRARLEDIEQLAVFSRRFESLGDFLTQLALLTNVDAEERETQSKRDDERLRLSSIHQAKGLEFRVVFVIMLCEGMFPNTRALDSAEGEEEERRLFYVAITRAKDELHLSYPLLRVTPGSGGLEMQQPSRFLSELPRELLDEWNLRQSHSM
ncbi:MAG: ATP-dependent helicase, partial [Verrucomicrobia bacterium]|nr:ATP-dependent helicase [Verrucomicrobiota bacterium]